MEAAVLSAKRENSEEKLQRQKKKGVPPGRKGLRQERRIKIIRLYKDFIRVP